MPYYPSYQQYYQPYQQPQQQSSLLHVQSEQQAREWSVSPGSSLMFIDDNAPYIYTKTAGNSQLEPCTFKKLMVSEIGTENASKTASPSESIELLPDSVRGEIEAIRAEIEDIKAKVKELTENESA